MENWRRYIEEMLNAPIKDRPAQHIYPDPEMYIDPVKGLGARNADILKDILDAGGQNIGKDRDRDIALAKFTERMKALLDQIDTPQQNRSPEEIQRFKEIDQAVKDIQAQIQMNCLLQLLAQGLVPRKLTITRLRKIFKYMEVLVLPGNMIATCFIEDRSYFL